MVISSKKESEAPQVVERLEEEEGGYTPRVQQARERVLGCKPSIDLERAKIVTESFMRTEGDPVVMRHAKAFREQCQRKKLFIQNGELIVGSPGGVIRAGNLAPDTKWQLVGEEALDCYNPLLTVDDLAHRALLTKSNLSQDDLWHVVPAERI